MSGARPGSMVPMSRLVAALAAVVVVAAACGSDGDTGEQLPEPTPVPTISGVGSLPDTVPAERSPIVRIPRPVNDDGSVADLPGEQIDGNRVLVIGDSIMASTAQRYGGQMCDELVPLGWAVEVEAEPSRFVEFGNRVLDRVFDPLGVLVGEADDWDAAVVFLGSNYRGDQDEYEAELREILDTLVPRPTLLYTVTEYRPNWSEVNEVVRALGAEYENVNVVDWEQISQAPGVISSDRQHPTEAGRVVLAEVTAAALGPAGFTEGECLRSVFTDDSAINSGGSSSSSSSSSASSSSSGSSSSSSSSSSGSSSSSSGSSSSGSSSGGSSSGGSTTGTEPPPTDGGTDGSSGGDSGTGGGGETPTEPQEPTPTQPPEPTPTQPPAPTPTQPPAPTPTSPPEPDPGDK